MSVFNSTQENYVMQKNKERRRERRDIVSANLFMGAFKKKEPVIGAKNTDKTRHKIQKFCRMTQRNKNAVPITRWVATELETVILDLNV